MVIDKPTISDFTNATHDHSTNAKGGLISETGLSTSVNASLDLADSAVQPPEIREKLTANRTYYVATTGSDSNDGLSSGNPFLTINHAYDIIKSIDLGGFVVTIKLANGTYNEALSISVPLVGGNLIIEGDTTTPSNVQWSNNSGTTLSTSIPNQVTVRGIDFSGTPSYYATAAGVGILNLNTCEWSGGSTTGFIGALSGGNVQLQVTQTITGGGARCLVAQGGTIAMQNVSITVTGTPNFTVQFALAQLLGKITQFSSSFTGSATGVRYNGSTNSVFSLGGSATFFPGDVAGSVNTGALYT